MVDNTLAQEQHALQNFSPTREKIKYTLGKMLKYAAIGAVVGGGLLALGSVAVTGIMGSIGFGLGATAVSLVVAGLTAAAAIASGPPGWVIGGLLAIGGLAIGGSAWAAFGAISTILGGGFLAAGAAGLMWGAAAGAVVGLMSGISGAGEAAEDRRDELDHNVRRGFQHAEEVNAMRLQRERQWLELQKQAQQAGVLSPQLGLPRGASPEMGRL